MITNERTSNGLTIEILQRARAILEERDGVWKRRKLRREQVDRINLTLSVRGVLWGAQGGSQ